MAKTLVFNFDGTGNEPSDAGEFAEDESISNVLKLHVLMGGGLESGETSAKTPDGDEQCAFYYNGIGTREGKLRIPLLGRLYSSGRSLVNMAFAPHWGDAARILREAKEDFDESYEAGDRVAVFGFSRGAALARKFVAMILREDADREVAFLGVFDTVAAMDGMHRKGEKITTDVVFENGTLHEGVKRAVHIVSLDEDRVTFTPTLINKDDSRPDRILEVWFPGVHSDIGGGYWHDGLSDLALEFMIGQCKAALGDGIRIHDGDRHTVRYLLDARGLIEDQGRGLSAMDVDDFVIHPMAAGTLHEHGGLIAKAGDQAPRRVCVNHNDRPDSDAVPLIHHSVKERFNSVPGYRPAALRSLKFALLQPDGERGEPIHGIGGLREIA
ncbi:MAG: DUF2235 domain-containing protein [Gammaproteobacteria bacterium]|nr:DUF2235 domain-containing protein [Gammaproteobacteria bacterium]MXW46491.1 DUF2235 domain-containing protein [Gammaproteobacteria bacterium]MYD02076.1 DUF2235 domain-containing protein [Gammaproteobacteria bacterium]MYI25427.1 DUF2235 domain-containing protein [Gammaproteobacteria bacterium]